MTRRRACRALCLLAACALMCAGAAPRAAAQEPSGAAAAIRAEIDGYIRDQNWSAVQQALRRLIALGETQQDLALQAEGWYRLGLRFAFLKSHAEARESFERALDLYRQHGNRVAMGNVRNELGLLAWQQGDGPAVRAQYGAAADDFAAGGRVDLQVAALRSLTFAQDLAAEEKMAVLERAWQLAGPLDIPRTKGLILHQIGDQLFVQGESARALEQLEAAEPLLAKAAVPSDYAALLTSLGRTLRAHGLPGRAISFYERALKLQQVAKDVRGQAQTVNAIAIALQAEGRTSEAIAAYERALTLAQSTRDPGMVALVQANFALGLIRVGDHARAVDLARAALHATASPFNQGDAHSILGHAYLELGRLDDARRESDEAIPILEAVGTQEMIAAAYEVRARIRARDPGDVGALADARHAIDIVEKLRGGAVPEDAMKRSFLDPYRSLFSLAVGLEYERGHPAEALEVAERGRARALADLLASRGAPASAATPGVATTAGEPRLPSPARMPKPSLAGIRSRVAAAGTTLLAYWVADDATFIWAVSPSGVVAARRVAVRAARLESLARQVWQDQGDALPAARPAAAGRIQGRGETSSTLAAPAKPALRELYDLLVAPVRDALPREPASLVSIVPHGPLFAVAFAALTDARGRYLIESYRLHEIPSIDLLEPSAPATAPDDPRRILLVADPSPMPSTEGVVLPALPGARGEVRAVARLLPAARSTLLVGPEATETRVRALAGSHTAIHLATHGLVFDDRPFDSYLALAREGTERVRDGRLAADEIYGLRLDADVVVLSACRTATGAVTGDGVVGLARAFFYAGTPSVVATLWDLADVPARHLLPAFYRRWLKDGQSSAALRDAQLALIAALRRGSVRVSTPLGELTLPEHPAMWAGVVLLGKP